ncbi:MULTISPECIES: DUF4326 domain-containing protein [unclassified Paracoccus (in: a-proteobacteria)]|uniref:DUF4326 domain-containing protein n=1 Tax=unclassified Paracoccus (in: a-proteobacteria) TaxID=2688777 RepID=UPI001E35DEE7|nr:MULTISPECIES: DUF4326 domain-containing protein [unclassified Paracoccus (in: a-proteobacteria)]UXU75524.1 DUF4326 domain-containing protein [Paracoccus sp. SMMA_5]UXU81429.1 DUF4326 domain-containing protein [Paracoccus sp. SMMA_5_TC]
MRPCAPTFNEQGWQTFWMAREDARQAVLTSLPALRGRPLACWCPPGCPCHADVLLDLANR